MTRVFAATAALSAGLLAHGQLGVTEIWAGGLSGSEFTSDWFELTNFGSAPVSLAGVYYDDESADPTENTPIQGISSIAPGESVIVLTGEDFAGDPTAPGVDEFVQMWGAPNGDLTGVQIGTVADGSGLGGGGDAVFIFDSNVAGATVLASASYNVETEPESFIYDEAGNAAFAAVGVLGAYEGNFPATNGIADAPVGSPGVVPEPASLALLAAGGALIARRRR